MDITSALALAVFLLLSFATSFTGARFRPGDWYESLAKPRLRPPNWLFGPVWSVLYCMIAVSAWLVWRDGGWSGAQLPLSIYAVQLVLNAVWSYIFFGRRQLGLALAEMTLLWLSIVAMMVTFFPVNATAGYLLIPYLIWVTFAWVLNLRILFMNPEPVR